MKIVLPRRRVVEADCYLVTAGKEGLPGLDRIPEPVAERAREVLAELERARRRSRRADVGNAVLVVYRLKRDEDLRHERLAHWAAQVGRLSAELESDVAVVLPPAEARDSARSGRVLTQLDLVGYRFRQYRSESENKARKRVDTRRALVIPPSSESSSYRRIRGPAAAVADGVRWARDLANTPPNVATPEWLARQAREYFRSVDARVEVLGPKGIARRRMGGLEAVGGGSRNSPRCVRVRIGTKGPKVALVGKGVTFDTGGISIKPAAAMDEMKYDKSGACAVMGIGRAAARLNLPFRLELYLPLAENMLDGASYRPSDIIRCMNGKTVEVLNTDAEGRLILADALCWAAQGDPDYLIDFATLTGACVVALGERAAGLFAPDDATAEALLEAAHAAGEYLWRMPLWQHFSKDMQGHHGDLKNAGPRWGGASTAAAFLKEFVGTATSWAHVDLAGPACQVPTGGKHKEATGYGVAMTVEWLRALGAA